MVVGELKTEPQRVLFDKLGVNLPGTMIVIMQAVHNKK